MPAFVFALLLLAGTACVPDGGSSYRSSQEQWSDLTDEQRAAMRQTVTGLDANSPVDVQTHADLAAKTPDEIRAIQPLVIPVLTLNQDVFPFPETQFMPLDPGACPYRHYVGSTGLTLNLTTVAEPDGPCGFGGDIANREVDAEAVVKWFTFSMGEGAGQVRSDGKAEKDPPSSGGTIKLRGGIFGE